MKLANSKELRKLKIELIYIYITINKANIEYSYNENIY